MIFQTIMLLMLFLLISKQLCFIKKNIPKKKSVYTYSPNLIINITDINHTCPNKIIDILYKKKY